MTVAVAKFTDVLNELRQYGITTLDRQKIFEDDTHTKLVKTIYTLTTQDIPEVREMSNYKSSLLFFDVLAGGDMVSRCLFYEPTLNKRRIQEFVNDRLKGFTNLPLCFCATDPWLKKYVYTFDHFKKTLEQTMNIYHFLKSSQLIEKMTMLHEKYVAAGESDEERAIVEDQAVALCNMVCKKLEIISEGNDAFDNINDFGHRFERRDFGRIKINQGGPYTQTWQLLALG